MATLLAPTRPVRPSEGAVDVYRRGFMSAVTVAALGLLTLGVLSLIGWATAPHAEAGVTDALRAAGQLWLLVHGVALPAQTGPFDVVPLGATAAMGAALGLGIARIVRSGGAGFGVRRLAPLSAGLLAGYCLSCFTVSVLLGEGWVAGFQSLFGGALLVTCALAGGVWWGRRHESGGHTGAVHAVFRGSLGGLGVVLAGGAVLALLTVGVGISAVAQVTGGLQAGWGGNVLLLVGQLCYSPVLAIWAAAVAVGPGFVLGAGDASLSGVTIGAIPAVPVLAALPEAGDFPLTAYLLLLLPMGAGAFAARLAGAGAVGRASAVCRGMAAGALAGVGLGVLCVPAAGPLADGWYATAGPHPLTVGLAAALEMAFAAGVTAWLSAGPRNWLRLRRS